FLSFFFLHDTLTTKIYPLSLHDALPISRRAQREEVADHYGIAAGFLAQRRQRDRFPGVSTERAHRMGKFRDLWGKDPARATGRQDRKSTRLNSSHVAISYAVFCLKKKK